jgi:hypothetical protein
VTVYDWKQLSKRQLNTYARLYLQGEFVRFGAEILNGNQDPQADFSVMTSQKYGVKVRALRWFNRPHESNYAFVEKSKLALREELLVALVLLQDRLPAEAFLIPTLAWKQPNRLLVNPDYEHKESAPEWGIRVYASTLPLLEPFRMETIVATL